MKQYRVIIPATKKVKTKATYTVVAKDKAAAGNMALADFRQHINIPGFSAVPQVTEV